MPTMHKATDARLRAAAIVDALGRAIDEGIQLPDWPVPSPVDDVGRALWLLVAAEEATRKGDVGAANAAIHAAHEHAARIAPDSIDGIELGARCVIVSTRRALKTGQAGEMLRVVTRTRNRLGNLGSARPIIRMALLELEASANLVAGRYDAARRAIEIGLGVNVEEQRYWRARFHRLRGAIHARQGYPLLAAHAYRGAIDDIMGGADRDARLELPVALDAGRLLSNLAMAYLMCGQCGQAHEAIEKALKLRRAHGASIAELANSSAVRALVLERLPGEGRPAWEAAVELARRSGDANLTVEIELRAATNLLLDGNIVEAEGFGAAAELKARDMTPVEPTVAVFLEEYRVQLALARHDTTAAHEGMKRAVRAYRALTAEYHEARIELLGARIEAQRGDVKAAARRAGRACLLALRGCFELCWRPDDKAVLLEYSAVGPTSIRRYCRLRGIGGAPVSTALLFDESGAIEFRGECHELGTRSVPYRLLRAIVQAGKRGIERRALGRALWGVEVSENTAANRLKVHIHKLRELLGRIPEPITSHRRTRGGETESFYRWNSDIEVRIVPRRS